MNRRAVSRLIMVGGAMLLMVPLMVLLFSVPGAVSGSNSDSPAIQPADASPPVLRVISSLGHEVAPFAGGQTFLIMGSGFEPVSEIHLILLISGVYNDISFLVSPAPPMTNEDGAFAATFDTNRFVTRGVMSADLASLTAVDVNLNVLATAPIALCDTAAETLDLWCGAPGVVSAE